MITVQCQLCGANRPQDEFYSKHRKPHLSMLCNLILKIRSFPAVFRRHDALFIAGLIGTVSQNSRGIKRSDTRQRFSAFRITVISRTVPAMKQQIE